MGFEQPAPGRYMHSWDKMLWAFTFGMEAKHTLGTRPGVHGYLGRERKQGVQSGLKRGETYCVNAGVLGDLRSEGNIF